MTTAKFVIPVLGMPPEARLDDGLQRLTSKAKAG
jgi:hypothetical protein